MSDIDNTIPEDDEATLPPTDDVDVIIEILNYNDYTAIEEKLRKIGFENDIHSGKICRWKIHGITVDIMPTSNTAISISNIWYPEGFTNAINCVIDETCTVKILSAPYFIATKLEAFKSRGKNDGRTSHDFEDIVFVLENRNIIWDEINNINSSVKIYLQTEFRRLSYNTSIIEWIDCHVERLSPPATYYILDKIKKI